MIQGAVTADREPIVRIVVRADEADAEPLIGMRLLHGYRILIEDVDGGLVQIDRL